MENQYVAVSKEIIDEGFKHAEAQDQSRVYQKLLLRIRQKCGHSGVKIGHVWWIISQLDENISLDEARTIECLEVAEMYIQGALCCE